MTWNLAYVSMNSLDDARLLAQYEEPTGPDEQVLDVCIFEKLKYFSAGTSEGRIQVFKFVQFGKTETPQRLVHTFTGHLRGVTSVCQFKKSDSLLLSASLDGMVRLWCLNTFTHHYTFNTAPSLNFAKIYQGGKYVHCGRSDMF